MSDTPRTDAVVSCPATADGWPVVYENMVMLARRLERELTWAKQRLRAVNRAQDEEIRAAADEARWRERLGDDDYGSF